MGIYTYKAVDREGKVVKGELEAKSELEVTTHLAKLGYLPVTVGFKGEKVISLWQRAFRRSRRKVSRQSLIIFTRQFATIIKAAVPILEGLKVLATQSEDPYLKEVLLKVVNDVEEGKRLSEAMEKHPGVFDQLYVNTVIAGETGGVLDKVLLRLADILEEEQETIANVKSALRYPIMTIVAMFVALFVLSTLVIPKFVKIYKDLNVSLPLPTRIMIFVSNTILGPWRESPNVGLKILWFFLLFSSFVALVFIFKLIISTSKGRFFWDRLKFEIVVLGKVYTKIVMLRFISMLNVLYRAGIPILKNLDIIKITINNVVLAREIEVIKKEVAGGKGISGGVLASKFFPHLVGYMISIGEKTGALSEMLDSLYEYFTLEVRSTLKNLVSLIEPMMTAMLAIVVLAMALAIFLPMWNLIEAFRQSSL